MPIGHACDEFVEFAKGRNSTLLTVVIKHQANEASSSSGLPGNLNMMDVSHISKASSMRLRARTRDVQATKYRRQLIVT